MKAELLIHDKVKDKHGGIIETKIWSVPKSKEMPYKFESIEKLFKDFYKDLREGMKDEG